MKHYKDTKNNTYSYEDNVPQDFLDAKIKELGLISITDEDLAILRLPTLEVAKQNKTNEINTVCGNEITRGFVSDALGSTHNYRSKEIDQLNLIGMVTAQQDDYFKCGVTDKNGVIAWNYVFHTVAQFTQVLQDGKAYKQTLLQKAGTLKAKVNLAKTQADLDLIVW